LGLTGTFLVYGFITAFTVMLVHFFIPETKGKSLEEIEATLITAGPEM